MDNFVTTESRSIFGKTFFLPRYNLTGIEKYILPKLDVPALQSVYYDPKDIDQVYKENHIDPQQLECRLKVGEHAESWQTLPKIQEKSEGVLINKEQLQSQLQQQPQPQNLNHLSLQPRIPPPLSQHGPTHFVYIPLTSSCGQFFINLIQPQIDANDLDSLVDVNSLHIALLSFRIRNISDLPRWNTLLQELHLKKLRVGMRGVGIVPVKPNTNYTKTLYIKAEGLEQLLDELVGKAIQEELVCKTELEGIAYDKQTQMYRTAVQMHMKVLQTKGQDIIDAGTYLKKLAKVSAGRVPVEQLRLAQVDSWHKNGFYDVCAVRVGKGK